MHTLCRLDIKKGRELYQTVISFINEIKLQLPITDVYLYGSLINGELNEGSDIDLVIVGNFKEPFFERIVQVMRYTDLPIEPLVYTKEEFNEMKRSKNPFIREVVKRGEKM